MKEFDLLAISDHEFEELCCDILATIYSTPASYGKPGRDSGVDGALRIDVCRVVLQAKQYAENAYSGLFGTLKHTEIAKAKKLKGVDRYVLMTSCELSENNCRAIVDLYDGVIKGCEDIWSGERIRAELSKPQCEWIVRRHPNLWLGGIRAIEEYLGDGLASKSEDVLNAIQEDLAHTITIQAFEKAKELLEKNRVIIITGQAGTGKTTIAKQLLADSVFTDKYLLVASGLDFGVCERELAHHPGRKTLFYIDDFLGSVCLEALAENRDSRIIALIRRIEKRPECRLILTSRTNIISEAKYRYWCSSGDRVERLMFELKDSSIGRVDKAKILYNQIFYGDVGNSDKECVFKDRNYFRIIDHRNFNPRIISYCFNASRAYNLVRTKGKSGLERILWMLDNPSEIWRDCMEELNAYELRLVMMVFLASGEATRSKLESASQRMLSLPEYAQFRIPALEEVLQKLCMSVLTTTITKLWTTSEVKYLLFNPSVGDYLVENYANDEHFLADLVLQYQDVRLTYDWLYQSPYFTPRTAYDNVRQKVSAVILNRFMAGMGSYDPVFVLKVFNKIVMDAYSPQFSVVDLGKAIAASSLIFKIVGNDEDVAFFLKWAKDNDLGLIDDARITKEFLDGHAKGIDQCRPLAMLNPIYAYRNYARPEWYYERIVKGSSDFADDIAQSRDWDEDDTEEHITEVVIQEFVDFLEECEISDEEIDSADCCCYFNGANYVYERCVSAEDEHEDYLAGGEKDEEDREITRIFSNLPGNL